jgi:hypothetical protein
MLHLRNLNDLREVAADPLARETVSPLGPDHAVLVERDALVALRNSGDGAELREVLHNLPCPVICLAEQGLEPGLLEVVDVLVRDHSDAVALLANIDRAPIAASILVQVLRTTPRLSIRQGLVLESVAYGTLQAGAEFEAWLANRQNSPAVALAVDQGPAVVIRREADALSLELNRPTSRNALSVEVRDALCEALQLALADRSIATVSISGAGRCFSVGGELSEFGTLPDPATAHAIRAIRQPALLLSQCTNRTQFRLHGACIGAGAELPAFGQRVVASQGTFFQLPEIQFGLIPGSGGCVSLPRRIGRHRTAYLALSARRIRASRALEWGLVDAVTG